MIDEEKSIENMRDDDHLLPIKIEGGVPDQTGRARFSEPAVAFSPN